MVSSVLWLHVPKQQISTAISGLLVFVLEWISRDAKWGHRLSGLVASWVILSMFFLWPQPITAWNNLLVGLAVAVLSIMAPDRLLASRRGV